MPEPTEVLLAETNEGRLVFKGNELLVYDTTSGDPCAVRMRSNNETIGKYSFDVNANGSWRELGYFSCKKDERGRTNPAHANAPEYEFWGHKAGTNSWEDPDYERLFAIRHDGVVFHKGGGGAGSVDKLVSSDGRFVTITQTDGHMVQYDTNLGPVGNPSAAVWSSWHGLLKPLPW